MAPPINVQDWYGDRHTCQIASGALANVTCVTRRLVYLEIWRDTWESTRERNRTSAHFVTKVSAGHATFSHITVVYTREINRTSVHCVTKVSVRQATCSHMCDMYTTTEDRINVLIAGRCLRQTVKCDFMYVFTLVQSHTHVDTVQTVLCGLTNWNDIYWSHTMKALGSLVTFVKRNSASVVTLRYTYGDMKVWSRM